MKSFTETALKIVMIAFLLVAIYCGLTTPLETPLMSDGGAPVPAVLAEK